MDTPVQDFKPRPPKPPTNTLELIERYVKLITQSIAIAVAIAGMIVGIAKYGKEVLRYATIIYDAVKTASKGETPGEGTEEFAPVTITYLYTVRKGDQLLDLCLHHQMSLRQAMDLNPHVKDPDKIEVKTRLVLRAQCKHTVGPGDILKVVSSKYSVTLKELMRANYKTRNYARRGEVLLIPYHVRP